VSDLKISELPQLAGANLAANDLLAVADTSASETRSITISDGIGKAVTLIADSTIPSAKVLFAAGSIPGSAIEGETVDTSQLANDAVSAAKLGDNSITRLVSTLPETGDFTGQFALDTDDLKLYCWNGSTWQAIKAGGSVNTVIGGSDGVVNVTVSQTGDSVTLNTTLDATSAAGQFLAGPTSSAGSVTYRVIAPADLPTASTTDKGAVLVSGNGLAMSGDQLVIDNTVTQNTSAYHLTQYTSKGLITAGRAITAADLPPAAAGTLGAVYPGSGLTVDTVGELGHSNAVSAGSGAKITFDAQGHVTGTLALEADDIPDLPATKLTTGELSAALLPTNGIEGGKLANFSTTKFGGATSTTNVVDFPTADYSGQFFYDVTNEDLYCYSGTGWIPITAVSGEIVFAGTFDASSGAGEVDAVTAAGTAIGLTASAALPAASASNTRYYLIVSVAGTPSGGNAPNVAMVAGDLIISTGTAWQYIGASATAGASSVSVASISGLTATNVQSALAELQLNKAALSGGTGAIFTGNITLNNANLVFEGATADDYETTLTVVDPTADRTITLPNQTGNVLVSGNASIVDGDVNASAAIAYSKLAALTSGNILVGNASNVATSVAMSGDVTISNTGATAIGLGKIEDGNIKTTAAIAFEKLANLTSGNILVGNSSNKAASVAMTGDIAITNAGLTSIQPGVIIDADIDGSAEIAVSKLANGTARQLLQTDAAGTGVEWASNISIPGTLGVTGETTLKEIKETVYTGLGTSGSIALDPANGTIQTTALTGNPTFTDSLQSGQSVLLVLANGSSYTVTWPTVTWVTANGNIAPTLTSSDMLAFFKIGSTLYAAYLGSYA
jgi:hypothetical protein